MIRKVRVHGWSARSRFVCCVCVRMCAYVCACIGGGGGEVGGCRSGKLKGEVVREVKGKE